MCNDIGIGFIGFGSMAGAIAAGLMRAGAVKAERIYACAAHFDRLCERVGALHINAVRTPREAVAQADVVVIAVKPHQVEQTVGPVRDSLSGKTVVSVAAGWDFARLEALVGEGVHHISTVPNTPVAVCAGVIAAEDKHSLDGGELALFNSLFGSIGLVESVPTEALSIAGTVAGCGPAYAAMFIEALGDAGVKHGLSRAAAYRFAAKMLEGTGKLYLEGGDHPGAMKDAVCSPGGTTIKGVASLERDGFRGAVIAAIDAAEGEG